MNAISRLATKLVPVLTALVLGASLAQPAASGGGVAAAVTDDSVLLRWSLPDRVFADGGFVITRTAAGSSRTFQVPSPMPRAAALAAGLVNDDEYDFLVAAFSTDGLGGPANEGDVAFARAIVALTTVARPAYARVTGTLFEDEEVEAGVNYSYTVETASGELIGSVEVTAGEVAELPPVDGLRAGFEDGAVELRWRRPAEQTLITAYHVYREHDGDETRLTEDPFFIPLELEEDMPLFGDDTVAPGERYTYRVEGIDLFGRVAPRSAPVTIIVPDPRPLAVPQIENSVAGDLEITIEWSPPQDDRVAAVGVRRYTDPDGPYELLTPEFLSADASSFTDEDVQGGVDYYYALVSVDSAGRISPQSNLWAARGYNPTPPSAPAGVELTESTDGLLLSWQAPPERDVASYRVYASRDEGAGVEEFRFVDLTADTSYRVEMLEGNLAQLHLAVSAVNSSDVEGPMSQVVSGRLIDATPPPTPRIVDVVAGQEQLEINWAKTAHPDVVSLRLYGSQADGPLELLAERLEPETGIFLMEEVPAGVEYTFVLEAVDASGNSSERSQPVSGRAYDVSAPEPVTGLEVTLTQGGVQLEWTPQPGVHYVVERSRAGADFFVELTDPLGDNSFIDAGGRVGDSYRVFAVNEAGRPGAPSEAVTVR